MPRAQWRSLTPKDFYDKLAGAKQPFCFYREHKTNNFADAADVALQVIPLFIWQEERLETPSKKSSTCTTHELLLYKATNHSFLVKLALLARLPAGIQQNAFSKTLPNETSFSIYSESCARLTALYCIVFLAGGQLPLRFH